MDAELYAAAVEALPEHLMQHIVALMRLPRSLRMEIGWWLNDDMVNEADVMADALAKGVVDRVLVDAVVTQSLRDRRTGCCGDYVDTLDDASFDSFVEGFPGDRLVLDYTKLWVRH
jgi:hypothetical protein